MHSASDEPWACARTLLEMAEPSFADEDFADAEAAYNAELAAELNDGDFEPVAESERRRRFHRELRARRTWLRAPSSVVPRSPSRRPPRLPRPTRRRARAPRRHRSARRLSALRCTRGDPDGDGGPPRRWRREAAQRSQVALLVAGEIHLGSRDKKHETGERPHTARLP